MMKGSWQEVRVQFLSSETAGNVVTDMNVLVCLCFISDYAYLTARVEVQKPPGLVHKIREVVQDSETSV